MSVTFPRVDPRRLDELFLDLLLLLLVVLSVLEFRSNDDCREDGRDVGLRRFELTVEGRRKLLERELLVSLSVN